MINSLTNEIWVNDKNEIFQVINFFDRVRNRWANKVRIIESEELGRAYWLEDSKEEGGHTEATTWLTMQIRLHSAGEIGEKCTPEEHAQQAARFFEAQRNIKAADLAA